MEVHVSKSEARGTSPQRKLSQKLARGEKIEERYIHFDPLSVCTYTATIIELFGGFETAEHDVKKMNPFENFVEKHWI